MISIATITSAIGAATSAVGLIDKISDQVTRFINKKSDSGVPKEHRMKIEKEGNAIVSKYHGVESQRITAEDLEKLPEKELRHIKILEKSMENYYSIWESVYPQLALAIDPISKAKTELQLKGIIEDMKEDLVGILNFLESAGLQLDDHYLHIRDVVKSV